MTVYALYMKIGHLGNFPEKVRKFLGIHTNSSPSRVYLDKDIGGF